MELNENHLSVFKNSLRVYNPQPALGSSPRLWYQSLQINCDIDIGLLSEIPLCRAEIFKISDFNIKIISILAWGGMNRKNARIFFSHRNGWERSLSNIASQQYNGTRSEAYDILKVLRDNGLRGIRDCEYLIGMGPAYFTKILYFFNLGYIMDQWTAKSYNLLINNDEIEISQNTVTNNNSGQKYERYCLLVEYLANELKMSPSAIEEAMFSNGGLNRGIWRQHVIDNT